jgi:hypothetical protein
MMKTSLVALAGLLVLGLAMPAAAQDSSARTDRSYNREVSFTYSYLRDVGENGNTGFVIDAGKQIGRHVSLVGEVGMNHFSSFDETYIQAAGGVRFGAVTSPRLRPYAQVMAGLQREFDINGFVVQPGAGVSLALARATDLKVQADFPVVRWDGGTFKQFRFTVGLGLALGGR